MKRKITPWLFLAPSLIGVCIFAGIPFLDVIRRSFCDAMGKNFNGIENYKIVFKSQAFLMAAKNTGRFLLVCIPLLLLLSLSLALLIQSTKFGRSFFKAVFLIPLAVPVASIVVLWKTLFQPQGIINALLAGIEAPAMDFMNTGKVFGVLIFSYLWKNTGYDMILWLAGLSGIPDSYYEAASVDGAGRITSFFYITLPLLLPNAAMIIILSLINSFKVFREAYLIAGNYPQEDIYMLQHLFNNWYVELDIQKMTAAAVMMAIVVFFIAAAFQKMGEDKETVSREQKLKRKTKGRRRG